MRRGLSLSAVVAIVGVMILGCQGNQQSKEETMVKPIAPFEAKDFSSLIGISGISEGAMRAHFALYQGYVKNTNRLVEEMKELVEQGQTETPHFAELKRRFGFEFDGMKLHELFFENLGGDGAPLSAKSRLYQAIERNFGSFETWLRDFTATGSMRGIGWVVLYHDPTTGRLMNAWINEHHVGVLSQCVPLLVMDVFEHAYFMDYQLDRGSYIQTILRNVNWKVVEARFEGKPGAKSNQGWEKKQ